MMVKIWLSQTDLDCLNAGEEVTMLEKYDIEVNDEEYNIQNKKGIYAKKR
jgi:hypothetical protein